MTDDPKYVQIADKIQPHLDRDFKIGKRDDDDFVELLKRLRELNTLSTSEYRYVRSNYRLIVLQLGLYHLVPELFSPNNLEHLYLQIARRLVIDGIKNGDYPDKITAINSLKEKLRENIIDKARIDYGIKPGDLNKLYSNFKSTLTDTKNNTDESEYTTILQTKVVDLLEDFKNSCLEFGLGGTSTYKLQVLQRELKSGKIKYFDDLIEKLDGWQQAFLDNK